MARGCAARVMVALVAAAALRGGDARRRGGLGGAAACPCSRRALCSPITTTPAREVVAFHVASAGDVWRQYAWDQVTTVAVFGRVSAGLLCAAHRAGARVVVGVSMATAAVANATARREWVAQQAAAVRAGFLDGVNIDIEGARDHAAALTALVQETAAALRADNAAAQVSVDTAMYPLRNTAGYDVAALAAAADFLIPMGYDMSWGATVASANAPLPGVVAGLAQYIDTLHVPAAKLVLGVPWYGYDFPCTNVPTAAAPRCLSAPGFDASWSRPFADVLRKVGRTPPVYDASSSSPYYTYRAPSGVWHQLWYDDETSLSAKYAAASTAGVRGIAMWTADFLSYANDRRVASMWRALAANFTVAAAHA